jgi:hypothetical protein
MAVKNIIAKGMGFDSGGDSMTKFIPTHGFSASASASPPPGAAGAAFREPFRDNRFLEPFRDNRFLEPFRGNTFIEPPREE